MEQNCKMFEWFGAMHKIQHGHDCTSQQVCLGFYEIAKYGLEGCQVRRSLQQVASDMNYVVI